MIPTTRFYGTLVATLLLALVLCAAPAAGADGGTTSMGTMGSQSGDGRQDNVFGTVDENMTMGRDADSGDTIMQVRPKPKPKQNNESGTPIIVQPEINITPQQRHERQDRFNHRNGRKSYDGFDQNGAHEPRDNRRPDDRRWRTPPTQ